MSERRKKLLAFATSLPSRLRGAVDVLTQDPVGPASVVSSFFDTADESPDRTFLLFEGQRFTWGEMARRIRRRSATLAAQGVKQGDAVALMMENHPQFLVNAWAIARLGAVISLINTNLTGQSLAHAVLSTKPRAICTGRAFLPTLQGALADSSNDIPWLWEETRNGHGHEELHAAKELAALDAEPAPLPRPAVTLGDDLFAYIFTSGTTGLPKAGKITHARSMTAASGFGRFTLGLSERDVLYVCLPLFHSSGFLIGASSAALTGATLALARKLSVSRFWDDICDTGATAFVYIGEACRYLLAAPPHARERSHRLTRIVGNGMRPDVWKAFAERFRPGLVHEFYGATEGNVNMTNLFGLEGSVGRMPPFFWLDNAYLAKFDRETESPVRGPDGLCIPCKSGEVGELLGRIDPAKVTMRFEGYLGDAATNAKIVRNVKQPGDMYFRSGDLLKKDWLGFYYFADRIGDTFRWKGENVSTNEVGDVCMRHEGVELASVYGVEVPGADGRAGMVALSLNEGGHFSPDRFYQHVMGALPSYAAPLFVRLIGEAAVTATFKLKKTDLQKEGFDPSKVSDHVFVRNDRTRTFEHLDAAGYAAIASGEHRL
jgi:fatty-acyl-CoA synthase